MAPFFCCLFSLEAEEAPTEPTQVKVCVEKQTEHQSRSTPEGGGPERLGSQGASFGRHTFGKELMKQV